MNVTALTVLSQALQASGQAPTAAAPPHGALWFVAAVNVVIWAGLFAYLLFLDRRVRALEAATAEATGSGREP